MQRNSIKQIFISHASEDKILALIVKELFDKVLKMKKTNKLVKIFCSSDISAIEGGKPWFEEIMLALRASQVCISLMTPNSIYKPWVLFESGGAYTLSTRKQKCLRMFPACAYGMKGNILPGPFTLIQARNLCDKNDVLQLCREIATIFGIAKFISPSRLVKKLLNESTRDSSDWANVHQVLAGDRLDSSPFSIDNFLNKANDYLFCAGQNLHHLTTNPRIKQQLFDWLKNQSSRQLNILICDPEEKAAVSAWDIIGQKYPQDLKNSIRSFRKWRKEAKSSGFGHKLSIKVTKLVTTGIVCLDPLAPTGKLILTPVVFGKPISAERPHFVISKRDNKRIFDHYWETYYDIFSRARSIDNVRI